MPKVFISYSHKDEDWKNRLQTQLEVLEMEGLLSIWEDRQIQAGNLWLPEIELALNTADVAILLISADFLVSKFIRGQEVPRLLERREKEGIRIIPLIIKPCPWRKVPWLSALQGASRDNIELSGLTEYQQDDALSKLAEKTHDLLNPTKTPTGSSNAVISNTSHNGENSVESLTSKLRSHELVTIDKLALAEAQPFFLALQKGFAKRFPGIELPKDASEMVEWFFSRDTTRVQQLFYLVRRALETQKGIKAAEEAATLLYCIAACRLVDTALAQTNMQQHNAEVLKVPHNENILCAVIATALFGGTLQLKPPDPSDALHIPRPEWILDVPGLPNGDNLIASIECAAFAAVFKNSRELSDLCLNTTGLTPDQSARLAARIDDIKDKELSLALVIYGISVSEAVADFSKKFQVPILLPSTEISDKLLGMDAKRLIAEIKELWDLIEDPNFIDAIPEQAQAYPD